MILLFLHYQFHSSYRLLTSFLIIISLLFSFFFSGMEIAYISANKLQMHVESRKETLTGRLFAHIINSPIRFLITLLLGNTLAVVLFGVLSAEVLGEILTRLSFSPAAILVIQSIITTVIVLVVADFIPKNLFRGNPTAVLKIFTLPCIILYYILLPFTIAALWLAYFLMKKLLGINLLKYKNTFSKTDLNSYINEHSSEALVGEMTEEEHEVKIFRKALSFPDVRVRDCMIPRMEITGMDIAEGFAKLKEKFEQTGLSRMIIYKENVDNIVGYVHFHEMFKTGVEIQNVLLQAALIPESMPARDALRSFMQQHKSLSVVVDEFGMTSGIITTEDILEEIFGDFEDVHDKTDLLERQTAPGEFVFSARHKIDYLNQKYGLSFPVSEDYLTLGGYIQKHTGNIPKARELLTINDYNIRILSSTPTRIEQVYIMKVKDGEGISLAGK